jgi:uncharacterized protein
MWFRAAPTLALCTVLSLTFRAGLAAAETPLPERRPDRWIYDTAGVIDDADEARLEALATELFGKTGVAIAVVTVPRLEQETIEALAVRVGQRWGVGRRGQDRGLVVALAREDRAIFVATGYGTEGYLPDGRVGGLIDRYAIPHLRADRFSPGLTDLVGALAAASAAEYGAELTGVPRAAAPPRPRLGIGRIIGAVLSALLLLYLGLRHPQLLFFLLLSGHGRRGGFGFGGGGGHGGFDGGGFGGGGAGRSF